MQDPRIGVVTVLYNSADHLPDFVASLAAQDGVQITLYAVDNASPDRSAEVLERCAAGTLDLRLLRRDRNVGIAMGNNIGIELALADAVDWVLLLNNDTSFGADTIRNLVDAAEQGGCSLLSPVIEAQDPPGSLWYGGAHLLPHRAFDVIHEDAGVSPAADRVTADPAEPTEYAPTCCLLVAPEVFARVGLMDASYFVYFDDVDFAVRCARAGYRYYVTSRSRLLHKAGASTGSGAGTELEPTFINGLIMRNRVLMTRRHLRGTMRLKVLAYIQVRILIAQLLRRYPVSFLAFRERWFLAGLRADLDDHSVPTFPR